MRLRLLGGLTLWVLTLYCSPAARGGHRRRRGQGGGLYPELSLLGIYEGKSPALIRTIGRLTALLPSYAAAQQELAEQGVALTVKEVHGIGGYAGQAALTYRARQLEEFRAGTLPAGAGAGRRFGAMIDGGRTKIRRTTRKQRGHGQTKKQKRRFRTDWREPKLLIVFEMDEQGRQKKGTRPILDGTFAGPDALMELLAMRLHQVGAAEAAVVAFRADGAPWVWERLPWVIQRLGLKPEQVSQGLDWCHAVHHLSLALAVFLDGAAKRRVFKKLRKWLKQGRWLQVTSDLVQRALAAGLPADAAVWTDIQYLERHGEAGHLDYATFRRRGLPLGSGAIESAIRRVINLRLKGNSVFWQEEKAEAMLVLRGLVVSKRWSEEFGKIMASLSQDRRPSRASPAPDMPAEIEAGKVAGLPKPQLQAAEAGCGAAA